MFGLAALLSLISQVSGTPYVVGGDSPAGTDCSGLASWVANVASGRPAFGSRFNTGNMEGALLARGFQYGSAPDSVVIGWDGGHAAVTLPDGTPVSSGESGTGVRVGGGGAYQPRFVHHMYLPVQATQVDAPADAAPPGEAPLPAPPAEPAPPWEQAPPADAAMPAPPNDAPILFEPAPPGEPVPPVDPGLPAPDAPAVIEFAVAAAPPAPEPGPIDLPAPAPAPEPVA